MKCDIWRQTLPLGQSAGAASRLMNRQQPIHSHREKEREPRNRGCRGRAGEKDWDGVKEKGKKERNRKRIVECNRGQWLVGSQVLCERRALSCMLCFVTGDLLWEIEKAATLIRSESSCSPSIFFCLSVPPLHSAIPLLFRTGLYERLRLVFVSVCTYALVCLLA